MGVPATSGSRRTTIASMNIGDYIACYYNATASGSPGLNNIQNLGQSSTSVTELSVSGQATGGGYFYLIKVDKGLLIADRIIQHTISWDVLNSNKLIQGLTKTLVDNNGTGQSINFIIRSLTGGVAYADDNGNKSTSRVVTSGAWPTNNEYDKYIWKSDLGGKITPGDDNVWHEFNVATWTQDTPIIAIINSNNRVIRGAYNGIVGAGYFNVAASSASGAGQGFRPVFQYNE